MKMKWKAVPGLAALSFALMAGAATAGPKVLMLHQWASGSDAAAIAKSRYSRDPDKTGQLRPC